MITLKETAAEAGVSMTTVSNVLRGKAEKASPEVEERIKKLLVKHNYVLKFGLDALTNKDFEVISILVSMPGFVERIPYERPFYGNITGEFGSILRKRRYYVMLFLSKNTPEITKMTVGWNAGGITSISMSVKCKQIGRQMGRPIVLIDMNEYDPVKTAGCFNVTFRDHEGGRHTMGYLLDQGVEKVVYLANTKSGTDQCRYLGASEVYGEYLGENVALEIRMLGRTYNERATVYDEVYGLIGFRSTLFFSTDFNVVEAIGYLQCRQISTSEDISVAGFDDDIYARLRNPRLTPAGVGVSRKAELAVNMLVCLIDGEEVRESEPKTDAVIVERESVMKVEEMGRSGQG